MSFRGSRPLTNPSSPYSTSNTRVVVPAVVVPIFIVIVTIGILVRCACVRANRRPRRDYYRHKMQSPVQKPVRTLIPRDEIESCPPLQLSTLLQEPPQSTGPPTGLAPPEPALQVPWQWNNHDGGRIRGETVPVSPLPEKIRASSAVTMMGGSGFNVCGSGDRPVSMGRTMAVRETWVNQGSRNRKSAERPLPVWEQERTDGNRNADDTPLPYVENPEHTIRDRC